MKLVLKGLIGGGAAGASYNIIGAESLRGAGYWCKLRFIATSQLLDDMINYHQN